MNYNNAIYLSKDRSLNVEFLFVEDGACHGWRAYILSHISYGIRSSSHVDVHRLTESSTNMIGLINNFKQNNPPTDSSVVRSSDIDYICWTESVYSLEQMMSIASAWTDITAYYIKHGGSFPEIQKQLTRLGVI